MKNILKNEIYLEKLGALAHSCNLKNLNAIETKKVFKDSGYPAHYSKKHIRKRMWDNIPYYAEVTDDYPAHICDKELEETNLNCIFKEFGSVIFHAAIKTLERDSLSIVSVIDGIVIKKHTESCVAIYEEVDKYEKGSGLNLIYFINKK